MGMTIESAKRSVIKFTAMVEQFGVEKYGKHLERAKRRYAMLQAMPEVKDKYRELNGLTV